ncbi:MAG: aerotolerance regulator BatA [Phycisphaerae bacterium]|nr:aerotolerance regulator BatA [Phycisphaerae bacterium]|tara:strand:+ start:7172 stop:8263 length:1092 start_codon:yes stop_codon:yes gene_type:complete
MFTFESNSAWFLLLALVIPLLWWRWSIRRRRATIPCSTTSLVSRLPRNWVVRTSWIIPTLRTVAVGSLIICIARPLRADQQTRVQADAVAIEMVVDRSGSMRALDFERNGQNVTRLEAVKAVVADFILGVDEMDGRENDLVGLVTFASYPDSNSPMTFDHAHLIDSLRQVKVASESEGPLTAIGDGLALAVSRLTSLQDRVDIRSDDDIKSRVIILLTDGEETAGDITAMKAAEMAAAFDIKIYTIGAGTTGIVPVLGEDARGRQIVQRMETTLDEETLREIAELTGGQYFRATDTESLQAIYQRINELETSEIIERQYNQYADMSVDSVRFGGFTFPPLLIIPLLALLLETILSSTRYRRLP